MHEGASWRVRAGPEMRRCWAGVCYVMFLLLMSHQLGQTEQAVSSVRCYLSLRRL